MDELLPGGRSGGAVLVAGTVRRPARPWTPAVHALLSHLARAGFDGCPRPLGVDDQGREVLSYLPGAVVGTTIPWPEWTHSDLALVAVAKWLRRFHAAVADFRPAADARWRRPHPPWTAGMVVGHGDAAPYNACWDSGRGELVGFFDWDDAGPTSVVDDLAAVAFSWTPLHARAVVRAEGFVAFDSRSRRLRLFLDAYGWTGTTAEVVATVRRQLLHQVDLLRRAAAEGDPAYVAMRVRGTDRDLLQAYAELGLEQEG